MDSVVQMHMSSQPELSPKFATAHSRGAFEMTYFENVNKSSQEKTRDAALQYTTFLEKQPLINL